MGSGIVIDIQRFALQDGPGIRTVVTFKGCPLHCPWCHNPEARRADPELAHLEYRCIACGVCARVCPNHAVKLEAGQPVILRDRCIVCGNCVDACVSRALILTGVRMSVESVMEDVRKDVAYYRKLGGGLTVSGGEPFEQIDFLVDLLQAAKAEGIETCVETSGCASREKLARVYPLTDLFLFDYKASGSTYRDLVGVDEAYILENLDFLYYQGAKIIMRCPLVPGVNDSPDHLEAIAHLSTAYPNLAGIEVLPYHNSYTSKFERYGYVNPLPNQPPAGEEDRKRWLAALENLGCRPVTVVS